MYILLIKRRRGISGRGWNNKIFIEKTLRMDRFSEKTIEAIKYYVYALLDPRDNKIFYIGKGKGNRVFAHMNGAIKNPEENDKISRILEIIAANFKVHHYILRSGIVDERTAYEVESTLIDLLTFDSYKHLSNITNLAAGHHSWDRGIKLVNEVESLYSAEPLDERKVIHNLLLININRTYKPGISPYEATRSSWKLSLEKAKNVDFVCSEYKGIIRAIYKPLIWKYSIDKKRIEFEGIEVTESKINELYLNKEYKGKKRGTANPVRYIGEMTQN